MSASLYHSGSSLEPEDERGFGLRPSPMNFQVLASRRQKEFVSRISQKEATAVKISDDGRASAAAHTGARGLARTLAVAQNAQPVGHVRDAGNGSRARFNLRFFQLVPH